MRILPPKPFRCCMPWRLRDPDEAAYGDVCCYCGRDVAAPIEARGKNVACIYCGLDRGDIPAVEVEPGETMNGLYRLPEGNQ